MDPALGDFDEADLLIEDGVIAEVRPGIEEAGGAEVVDARRRIVVPGFVDTHRHMWQAALRQIAPDHTLGEYFADVLGRLAPMIRPDDAYLGNLLSALGALDAGVTTVQDTANLQGGPDHADALVGALRDSGLRAVFAYGTLGGRDGRGTRGGVSPDAERIRRTLLPSDDALVTMALCTEAAGPEAARWNHRLADELGLRTVLHMNQPASARPVSGMRRLGVLRPGTVFIHGNRLDTAEMRLIADSGGFLSVAPAIEMMMGHGMPPFATADRAGLPTSLSADVEVAAAGDMFTQMRAAFQCARYSRLREDGDGPLPSVRDVLAMATIQGARALGLDGRTGSLTPGKQADLVVLRTDRPGVAPAHDPYGAVVLGMDRADVETVLVAGVPVKRDGALLHPGLPKLLTAAERLREDLARARR
jgi:cytosine/adenosine deaminase-related metal-dependent hydrolase